MPANSKHGGKREGAGKPALFGFPMKRVNVMLDLETIEFYKQHGASLSEGIRNHWRGITMHAADLGKAPTKKSLSKPGRGSVSRHEQKPTPSG